MNNKIKLLLLAAGVLLAACSTPKKLGFLRDLEYNAPFAAIPAPELKLKVDDRISVQVFCDEPTLAVPFNAMGLTNDETAELLTATYGVDVRGDIEFPVLGTMHVEGMTLKQVQEEIAGQIIKKGYIKEPVVKVELVNFTVNIIQVLAQIESKDTENAKLPDVMVIRTENGEREAYSVNLQSKELYNSPVFYLQQNDVVYVQPRGLRLSTGGDVFIRVLSPIVSAISAFAYILLWTSAR